MFFGSPAYLAPEQIQDPASVDARADVWALGVLLYNLISGTVPFDADSVSGVIVAVVYDAPALLTEAPYELARVVQRCLEKDRSKRPQNVSELAAALAPFAVAGARLSERVRLMLDAPPRAALVDASASGSMPPVSISVAPEGTAPESNDPLPLVKKRAAAAPARPSSRLVARRRQLRQRSAVVGLLGAAAVIALVTSLTAASSLPGLLSGALAGDRLTDTRSALEVHEATEPSAPMQTAEVPPFIPSIAPFTTGITTTTVADLPNALPLSISFGPTSRQPPTETPLAAMPTPLATSPLMRAPPASQPPATPLAIPRSALPTPVPNAPNGPPSSKQAAPRLQPWPETPPQTQTQTRSTPAGAGGDKGARGAKAWAPPPGLPTSREAAPHGAPPTRPPPRSNAAPPSSRPDDANYLKQFNTRK